MVFFKDPFEFDSAKKFKMIKIHNISFDDRLITIEDIYGNIIKCYPEDLE